MRAHLGRGGGTSGTPTEAFAVLLTSDGPPALGVRPSIILVDAEEAPITRWSGVSCKLLHLMT